MVKRQDVTIGSTWFATVSGRRVKVRITEDRGIQYGDFRKARRHGGWTAINLTTNKGIHIKTAARLRRIVMVASS